MARTIRSSARWALHFKKMEARYGSLLDSAPDAMVVTDRNGEIVLVNAMAAAQFGYDGHDLIGCKLVQIATGALVEQIEAAGAEATAAALAERGATGVELVGTRKDGSRFPRRGDVQPGRGRRRRAAAGRDPQCHCAQGG